VPEGVPGCVVWILLSLVAALGATGRESLVKSVMRDGDEVPVAFIIAAGCAALLLPAGLLAGGRVHGEDFWWALLVSGGINAIAAVMVARAVHLSDLSLVSPLQSTTPLFMIVTGAVLLGEMPDATGMAGIAVVVAGAWLLNLRDRRAALLDPFRALGRDPGARLFLGVAALFSISAAVDKVGVLASAPLLWAGAVNAFVVLALGARLAATDRAGLLRRCLAAAPARLAGAAAIMSIGLAAQMMALPLTLAAYVIAVKRSSALFSVLAGRVLFGEPAFMRRLAGAAVMLAGFILLTLARQG
jgi:drug/metabolite transporter (DMT)-like permease